MLSLSSAQAELAGLRAQDAEWLRSLHAALGLPLSAPTGKDKRKATKSPKPAPTRTPPPRFARPLPPPRRANSCVVPLHPTRPLLLTICAPRRWLLRLSLHHSSTSGRNSRRPSGACMAPRSTRDDGWPEKNKHGDQMVWAATASANTTPSPLHSAPAAAAARWSSSGTARVSMPP